MVTCVPGGCVLYVHGGGVQQVSDGAKIKTRKLNMLNTAVVTAKGVLPVQQTDATGKKP